MCFDQKSSFGFAIFGLLVAAKLYHKTRDWAIAGSVFFFFTMELLQGFQYFWIDDCDNPINKVLTLLGLLHICCQPFFLNLINSRTTHSTRIKNYFTVILRLCVVGGLWLFSRMVWGYLYGWSDPITGRDQSTEWLRGAKLCTFSGRFHLAWETPMADSSYFVPGVALHSFLMFAPLLCVKWNTVPVSVFLFLTGPALAAWITPSQHEQASIWCFFSIAQIAIIIIGFCYRIHWFGDEKKKRQWAHWMPRRWNYPAKYLQKEAPKANAGGKKKN